ncbi:MAG TPA: hypothetical protein VFQ41_24995 [Candidatus Angelobacter sp.]|nr:hypothetical protein [Candidatus Angelobacter sp.]
MSYVFNSRVSVRSLTCSSTQKQVLCEVPAQNDSIIRYAVPASLIDLLELFDGTRTVEDVTSMYNRAHPDSTYSVESVSTLIQDFCIPKGILHSQAGPPVVPEASRQKGYLYFKMKLLPHSLVYPLARLMGVLFWKPVFILLGSLILIAHVVAYFFLIPGRHLNINDIAGRPLLDVTLITILAALFHEFGHASALARNRCNHLEIGLGLYLRFPVLYTDVSEAWKFAPMQRVLVDIGGLYFQNICVIVLTGLFFWHPSPTYLYCIILIDMSMSLSLNPFLRMDGYWLLADLFGIYNLREQSIAVLKYLPQLFRRNRSVRPQFLDMKKNSFIALCVYTVLSFTFFTYLVIIATYQTIFYLLPAYPHLWSSFFSALRHEPSFSNIGGGLFHIAWKTAVLIGCLQFAWRSVQKTIGFLWRWISGHLSRTPVEELSIVREVNGPAKEA